jgi:hypothetical protein
MLKLHDDSPWIYFVEVQFDNIAWRFKNQKRYLADAPSSDGILKFAGRVSGAILGA